MKIVNRSFALAFAAVSLVACGGAAEEAGRPAQMPEPSAPGNAPMVVEQEQVQMMQSQVEQPTAAPRLSHVVTLGSQEEYAPMPVPGQGPAQGTTVVINNNVNVGGGYGYGGYAYGYGGGGYGRGYYRGTPSQQTGSQYQASHSTGGAWGATGWEGAGRTAAPGHTPNVGGNYSAPASAGPRAMR